MNKNVLIASTVFVVLAVGSAAYLVLTRGDSHSNTSMSQESADHASHSPQEMENHSSPQDEPTQQTAQGAYVEYSPDVIASTSGTKVLYFHAPWCPQCRELEADIQAKGAPSGVTIIKVDYDTNQTLRQKYGVTVQTTLVRIDDQGNELAKFVAYDDPSVAAIRENLL